MTQFHMKRNITTIPSRIENNKKERYDTTWHGIKHYDKIEEYDTLN